MRNEASCRNRFRYPPSSAKLGILNLLHRPRRAAGHIAWRAFRSCAVNSLPSFRGVRFLCTAAPVASFFVSP